MSIEKLRAKSYWSEAEGREAVELWRRSGESLSRFETRTGISRARVGYWLSRCDHDSRAPTTIELAPVTVIPSSTCGALSIELRSGRVVRIDGDVDDDLLARVIVVAERAGC